MTGRPHRALDELDGEFGFWLDVCTTARNAECAAWFGPDHPDPERRDRLCPDLDALVDLVADGDVVVLSGTGLSTDSGNQSRTQPADRSVAIRLATSHCDIPLRREPRCRPTSQQLGFPASRRLRRVPEPGRLLLHLSTAGSSRTDRSWSWGGIHHVADERPSPSTTPVGGEHGRCPGLDPDGPSELDALADFAAQGGVVVLSGAGLSNRQWRGVPDVAS